MTTAIKTKERPILFCGPMVQAILDGIKTQTRRIFKPQPVRGMACDHWEFDGQVYISDEFMQDHLFHEVYGVKGSPYGSVYGDGSADRLWVRETWRGHPGDIDDPITLNYKAGDHVRDIDRDSVQWERHEDLLDWKWKPSIHMPRWASRITLKLTNVRIERLHAITEADAIAEGNPMYDVKTEAKFAIPGPIFRFEHLWKHINGAVSWDVNPWVWVIEFKKL